MKEKYTVFDPAEHLKSDTAIAEFIVAAIETNDAAFIAEALGVAARAKGMSKVARDAGLARESLYRSLRKGGRPELSTLMRIMHVFGLKLAAQPEPKKKNRPKAA
ncbi:MAG: hypothetical protein QOK29_3572 [Rhodospirillaceae bacterium]|nr:hypothetical protein [Rhodospirillaceae bacterium]